MPSALLSSWVAVSATLCASHPCPRCRSYIPCRRPRGVPGPRGSGAFPCEGPPSSLGRSPQPGPPSSLALPAGCWDSCASSEAGPQLRGAGVLQAASAARHRGNHSPGQGAGPRPALGRGRPVLRNGGAGCSSATLGERGEGCGGRGDKSEPHGLRVTASAPPALRPRCWGPRASGISWEVGAFCGPPPPFPPRVSRGAGPRGRVGRGRVLRGPSARFCCERNSALKEYAG